MKVPPKRKGNDGLIRISIYRGGPSMKVPPKRKGNFETVAQVIADLEVPQ